LAFNNLEERVTNSKGPSSGRGTIGAVVSWAAGYDFLIWLVTLGRERRFRDRLLRPAHLKPGESVLDVGCGTGSLAIAAKRHVGAGGSVYAIDASVPMIVRARHKAKKAGAQVTFESGIAQSLPFPDNRFDVVLNTVMLHHLPRKAREECVREMRRVLKPGGRLLAVEFGGDAPHWKGPIAHLHKHGQIKPRELADLMSGAGLEVVEKGGLGIWDLQFVLAEART
jgi:ubiquinone/menaquinone biosynthesis C-methylase UbiE